MEKVNCSGLESLKSPPEEVMFALKPEGPRAIYPSLDLGQECEGALIVQRPEVPECR